MKTIYHYILIKTISKPMNVINSYVLVKTDINVFLNA